MKANRSFNIAALLLGVILLLLVVINFVPSPALATAAGAASYLSAQAATPTPTAGDSEIGSTDGILVMGIVITLIVTLPLVFRKGK
ncbi:MAG: hypothetical protein DYG85_13085 [Chloroflexi bacterium CFX1]|nr:hypothetical protein [Chloroflexi bacterium CFX1]MCQ3953821.1 hypothetical protein [Chloroflexota bacterium]MDL1919373.1 hypothetical protein [Chloroflexi bacterium CFX5]NUQ59797.1 hypothetical protein [Anaerolineales bacterium]